MGEILHPWRLDEILAHDEIINVQDACKDVMDFFGYTPIDDPSQKLDFDNFETVRFDTKFTSDFSSNRQN